MEDKNVGKTFSLDKYKSSIKGMIGTNDNAYSGQWGRGFGGMSSERTLEEVNDIVNSGDVETQRRLSKEFFAKGGFYARIIAHYATLLKYVFLLTPNPTQGKSLSKTHISKRYFSAIDFLDKQPLKLLFSNCATKVFVEGSYYGVIQEINKDLFSILDLPSEYCSSNFKDPQGRDLIEFDLKYFDTIFEDKSRENALKTYPKEVSRAYRIWKNGGGDGSSTIFIPAEIGIYFTLFDERPFFLDVIPASIEYDETVGTERDKNLEEIRKIIVQKIPHFPDGTFLFEPEEAAAIHDGTVKMMRGNKNVSILTTFTDVDSIVSRSAADTKSNSIERMSQHVYSKGGVSGNVFASTGSTTLETSLKNDLSLVMKLVDKFSFFMTGVVNGLFENSNINFDFTFLPVSYYNEDKFIDTALKLANAGYSQVLPAIAMGISQRGLGNLKELENDILELSEKLIPLSSAHTQSENGDGKPGAPKKEQEEKAPQTIRNEESMDEQAGGSN